MKANWKHLVSALAIAVLTAMPNQAVAAVKNVMCVKTNTGQYFPVVRISMMVIPDGGSTFEIVLKDGEGEANVESVSFEKHEVDIDFTKYNGTGYNELPAIDLTKPCYLLTSTGKYWTVSQMPQLTAKDGSNLFDVTVGSTTEADVESVWFYRGDDVEKPMGGDLNNDSEVDINDVVMLVGYILDKSFSINKDAADMNGDGEIDISDVVTLVANILNNTEERQQLRTPVRSQLYISGCDTATQAQLYSMDGKLCGTFSVANGATTMYVGNLTPGVYIIKVGKKSLKFIKK